jgi:hypothetical protein
VVELDKGTDDISGLNCFSDGCKTRVISEPVGNIHKKSVPFRITYFAHSNLYISDLILARVDKFYPAIIDSSFYILPQIHDCEDKLPIEISLTINFVVYLFNLLSIHILHYNYTQLYLPSCRLLEKYYSILWRRQQPKHQTSIWY